MHNMTVFTGAPNTGKTFIAKYCSYIFSRVGKRVALIDATINRGMYFSLALDETYPLQYNSDFGLLSMSKNCKNKAYNTGTVDVFTDSPEKIVDMNDFFVNFESISNDYDLIFIDGDIQFSVDFLNSNPNQKIVIVQDCSRYSQFCCQKQLLFPLVKKLGNSNFANIIIVINKFIQCKMKLEAIRDNFNCIKDGATTEPLLAGVKTDEVLIEFSMDAFYADLNNTVNGSIEARRLDNGTKKELLNLCSLIEIVDIKKI